MLYLTGVTEGFLIVAPFIYTSSDCKIMDKSTKSKAWFTAQWG